RLHPGLNLRERRLRISGQALALEPVLLRWQPHRLRQEGHEIDDGERVAALLVTDLALAGVIDGGQDVDTGRGGRLAHTRNVLLPGRPSERVDVSRATVTAERRRVVDLDVLEARDRAQDRARARPVEVLLRVARVVVERHLPRDRP